MFWRRQVSRPEEAVPERLDFFTRRDLLVGTVAAGLALLSYLLSLAPSVTFEQAGFLTTAAAHLGVPQPPGYPLWTMLAFVWSRLLPLGNLAWRLNLFSACCTAAGVGLMALLVSRSSQVMLVRLGLWQRLNRRPGADWLVGVAALAAALSFGFSNMVWSQAVISSVHGLNLLVLLLVLTALYRWSFQTEATGWLYAAAFLWGAGLTGLHSLALWIVVLPWFVWLAEPRLGRELLLVALLLLLGVLVKMLLSGDSLWYQGPFPLLVLLGTALGALWAIRWLWRHLPAAGPPRRAVLGVILAALAGVGLYGYEPIAAAANPPLNWGYTHLWQGFVHHVLRAPYEHLPEHQDLLQLWGQLNLLLHGLQLEFTVGLALLGLVPWFFYTELTGVSRDWLRFLLVAFAVLVLGLLLLANPALAEHLHQQQRVDFLPVFCLFGLWIGYGLVLAAAYLSTRPWGGWAFPWGLCLVIGLLPLVPVLRQRPAVSQRDHDFGYRLGYLLFQPGGGYPPMEHGAILLAGSSSGAALASHMIFVESQARPATRTQPRCCPGAANFDRRDVHLLNQAGLADPLYVQSAQDLYGRNRPHAGDPHSLRDRPLWQQMVFWNVWQWLGRELMYPPTTLWLPARSDLARLYSEFHDQYQRRPAVAGEQVDWDNGRLRIRGLGALNALQATVSQEIFNRNKDQHAFYAEDSPAAAWAYAYAEPYGLIFRLRPEPTELTPALLLRDRQYWAELTRELLADPRFGRDVQAQRSLARLRANLAGLYAQRGLVGEAERAFLQALQLCAASAEATHRLAQLYAGLDRFEEAVAVLEQHRRLEPYNRLTLQALADLRRRQISR